MFKRRKTDKTPKVRKLTDKQTEDVLEKINRSNLDQECIEFIKDTIYGNAWFARQLELGLLTITKLRKLFHVQGSEKASNRNPRGKKNNGRNDSVPQNDKDSKAKGHGRNSADDYTSAAVEDAQHPKLNPGDTCPEEECEGRLYEMSNPGILLRITGGHLAQATKYNIQKLRCAVCEAIYTAPLPNGVSDKKYDASFVAMLMINKYFMSVPLYRQDQLQKYLGVPVPSSTQWELMAAHKLMLEKLYGAFYLQAANGIGICYDDTSVKILNEIKKKKRAEKGKKQEHNCFTTGIVSVHEDYRVYLYMSDNRTAGKSIDDLLKFRDTELPSPMLMCDALAANIPSNISKDLYVMCFCLTHARRQFYELPDGYDDLADTVISLIGAVYDNEATAKILKPEERLEYHKENSQQPMDKLKTFLKAQQAEFEPNGAAGIAINYILKRFTELSQFLRYADAPIDNNITERALKLVIQTRKSSMFYKTLNSAAIASYIQSALYSAAQNGVNPYEYMLALLTNEEKVIASPEQWFPWNYQKTLQAEAGKALHDGDKATTDP